jgi:hypothetical protein
MRIFAKKFISKRISLISSPLPLKKLFILLKIIKWLKDDARDATQMPFEKDGLKIKGIKR